MTSAVPGKGGKTGFKGSVLWVQGLACGALLTFAAPTALVLAVLLAPALACSLGERGAGGGTARSVALYCGAAALRPLWRLWMQGDRLDAAFLALSDPAVLVLAWGAGACAWAMCQVIPVVVRTLWEARKLARARTIEAELARLQGEWDLAADR